VNFLNKTGRFFSKTGDLLLPFSADLLLPKIADTKLLVTHDQVFRDWV
jgi:hypothetical protein